MAVQAVSGDIYDSACNLNTLTNINNIININNINNININNNKRSGYLPARCVHTGRTGATI